MSMYPGHRSMGGAPPANGAGGRLNELLDSIRAEFESHLRQTEGYEHQCKTTMFLHTVGYMVWRKCLGRFVDALIGYLHSR